MGFAERLKEVLAQKGISEYKLAQMTGLRGSTINSITSGKSRSPTQKTLETIAKALDMSVSELLGENKPDIIVKQIDSDTGIGIGRKYIDEYSEDDIKLALEIIDLIRRHQS